VTGQWYSLYNVGLSVTGQWYSLYNVYYTENTTVLLVTKSTLFREYLCPVTDKPTLYSEYHCSVTDKNLHYTENTTVLSLTQTYIIQRIPLSCHWRKPTLYREYHSPVTDKNLHYTETTTVLSLTNLHHTENTTVLSLTKTYIIQRIQLSCHWQKPTLYRKYHCPVTDKPTSVGLSVTGQWYSLYNVGLCQWQDSGIPCIM
jgi:hypothetical protein